MSERHQDPKYLLRIGTLAAEKAMRGKRPNPTTFRKGENAAFKAILIADPQAGTSTHKHRTARYSHGVARIAHRATLLARRLLWGPPGHRPEWAKRLSERDLFGRSRRPAVRIRKSRRRKVESEIEAMVRHGYSPKYAAQVAYHPRAHGRDETKMYWHRVSPDVWITARRHHVQTESYGGGMRGHDVVFRVDGRNKDREGWRVDRGGLMGWEAIDRSEGFKTAAAGKAYAKKYLDEIREQKTLTPRVARDCVGIHTHENLGHAMLEKHGRDPGRLTAAARRRLRPRQFALPAREALPLDTPKRIRSAASRLEQMRRRGTVTASEYRRAHARIRAAEKRHGIGPFHHRRR